MLKRVIFVLLLAVQFFAVSSTTRAVDPYPDCYPCPYAGK